jgi:hypothetical protein
MSLQFSGKHDPLNRLKPGPRDEVLEAIGEAIASRERIEQDHLVADLGREIVDYLTSRYQIDAPVIVQAKARKLAAGVKAFADWAYQARH